LSNEKICIFVKAKNCDRSRSVSSQKAKWQAHGHLSDFLRRNGDRRY